MSSYKLVNTHTAVVEQTLLSIRRLQCRQAAVIVSSVSKPYRGEVVELCPPRPPSLVDDDADEKSSRGTIASDEDADDTKLIGGGNGDDFKDGYRYMDCDDCIRKVVVKRGIDVFA
ncbi:hypothetical protein DPMN_181389 [Dreissena polymorpha]|uniref:Uncharacterized protein n=1 Tax=Dreissena polymorpha TaxID=45954 RepID=A0A9D4DCS8_DREPO|nr:hypothetical protein DPMN_181389 [Dreissena polymorpha]